MSHLNTSETTFSIFENETLFSLKLWTQIKVNGKHILPKMAFWQNAENCFYAILPNFFLQNDALLQNAENLFIIKISKVYDYLFIL